MRLFAAALLATRRKGQFQTSEHIPLLVVANSEIEAGKEAKRKARKTYPKNEGWQIVGRVVEIDHSRLLEILINADGPFMKELQKDPQTVAAPHT
ncbi:MAG TPA: hypothetical protein VFC63_09475 [Blastocatellia bacterium]|nr:hypothetical protein [Blastocatellia bacterium]